MDEADFPTWQRRRRIITLTAIGVLMTCAAAAAVSARAHPIAVVALCYAAAFGVSAPIILGIRRLHTSDLLAHRTSLELGTAVPTTLEFKSTKFSSNSQHPPLAEVPRHDRTLISFLTKKLEERGFGVAGTDQEDGIWWIEMAGGRFAVTIGCTSALLTPGGFLVFIEPAAPFVRTWLRRQPTAASLKEIGDALFAILRESGNVEQLRWRTSPEELEDRFGPKGGG